MRAILMILAIVALSVSCGNHEAQHQAFINKTKSEMDKATQQKADSLKTIVQNFYDALSTTPNEQTATQTATYMVDNWVSTPTPPGGTDLAGFVQTLNMFHGMIPDLDWAVQEMLVAENKVIVRSRATGTPNSPEGYFFGVPTDGSKAFDVQTIDIHTVEDGKIVRSYHCEDWATAIQQVSEVKE